MTMKQQSSPFRFRKHMSIGEAAAELDSDFLSDCFEDTGDLERLRDINDKRRIIIGRTGSGKSALLIKLQELESGAITIQPESLSLQYLSNSTIINHLNQLGVHLDRFFKLLWQHIFTVELIKFKFPMQSEADKNRFLDYFRNLFGGNRNKEKALKYLHEWGESFFETTEYRIKEITGKFEGQFKASLGTRSALLDGSLASESKVAAEEKAEIIHRAQEIVNGTQVAELNSLFRILEEDIFPKPQPPHPYILIDRLDEGWVDDDIRYFLIRSLIETVRDFVRIRGVKIIVVLRRDLIDRVFRLTRVSGTQEEKFETLYLKLQWDQAQLLELLDKRVNQLVKRQYSSLLVSWKDLMPKTVGGKETGAYLVGRTLYRPRDIITLFNSCIAKAEGQPQITAAMLREAEAEYSESRFRALADEWRTDYPDLEAFRVFLKGRPSTFVIGDIQENFVASKCLEIATREGSAGGKPNEWATFVAEGRMSPYDFLRRLVSAFYHVGIVGLKTERFEATRWSFLQGAFIPPEEIDAETKITIWPAFHRYLGVAPEGTK